MARTKLFSNLLLILIFITLGSISNNLKAESGTSLYKFEKSQSIKDDLALAIDQAKQQNKMLMLVLGASWCHDSLGFAKKLSSDSMQKLVNEKYLPLFIDVGYFEDRSTITKPFGFPAVYSTPTVLVINPFNNKLINGDSILTWNNSASVELAKFEEYFSSLKLNMFNGDYSLLTKEQKKYIESLTDRLNAGFDTLRPLWKASDEGDETHKDEVTRLFFEVSGLRTKIKQTLHAMIQQDSDVEDIDDLPTFKPFSWEK